MLALAMAAHAAETTEITIEKRPFVIRHSVSAAAMPGEVSLLKLNADSWSDFEITRIAPHGTRVSKGDVLVAFDPEGIDKKLHDVRKAAEARGLEIAQTRLDLAHLDTTMPHRMDAMKRAASEAKEENDYFTKTRRKSSEEGADQRLKRAEIYLENEREELRQLEKMYAADDLTEETEEIILKRQKDQVVAAEFELRMQKLSHVRTLEVLLPREAVTLANAERDTALALAKFIEEAPRAITRKKLELQALETADTREKESLAKLEADRKQFEITAPSDGWFYHGVIDNGRWITGELIKPLVPHGNPVPRKPFATFIPASAKLKLVASLKGDAASQLGKDNSGVAWISGREDAEFPVKLTLVNAAPGPDGQFAAEFSAQWPEKLKVAPASSVNISLITYQSPDAIVVPAKTLEFGASGWTVAVKLADGKTERRPVKRGRVFNDECEILSGLEPGQVVVAP
jgi:multidrug efflux pump subunit AcrA (membrane-fusion protein)